MTQFLRAEAQPLVRWHDMYETQQAAVSAIVHMLAEAVAGLPLPASMAELDANQDWLRDSCTTQLAFLSGKRGTGKTSVMASLRKACSQHLSQGELEKVKFPNDLFGLVTQVRSRLVWLEPLDMEVSNDSSNLVAAILARIEAKLQSVAGPRGSASTPGEMGGLLDKESLARDPFLELQRFQTNMSLAWDKDFRERRPYLDPDDLAVESIRFEKSRLSLAQNFDRILNGFASMEIRSNSAIAVTNPLFVVPIDDFDLCPSSCLELLRVLRMISVPRLFFLVLGDLDGADLVLNLKFSADLAKVAEGVLYQGFLAIQLDEVAETASAVTTNALRKLIPPAQRVRLLDPTLQEALNFRPIGHAADAPYLHDLLADCPVFDSVETSGRRKQIANVLSLMLPMPAIPIENGRPLSAAMLDGPQLIALSLLQAPSRSIADLWYGLQRLKPRIPKTSDDLSPEDSERWHQDLCQFIGELCHESWGQDYGVPLIQRREVPPVFRQSSPGKWSLGSLGLRVDSTVSRAVTIEASESVKSDTWVEFQLNRINNWRLIALSDPKMVGPGTSTSDRRPLSPQTTGAVILFHDVVIDRQESASLLHRSDDYSLQWAVTGWRRGLNQVDLPWPVAACSRFWEQDWFTYNWNDFLSRWASNLTDPTLGSGLAAFGWIHNATMCIASGVRDFSTESAEHLPWKDLFAELTKLIPEPSDKSYVAGQRRDWLAKVGSMLMPEMALNVPKIKLPEKLIHFWGTEKLAIARRRSNRLAQLVAGGLGELAERLRAESPKHFPTDAFRPSRKSVELMAARLGLEMKPDVEFDSEEEGPRRRAQVTQKKQTSSRAPRKK